MEREMADLRAKSAEEKEQARLEALEKQAKPILAAAWLKPHGDNTGDTRTLASALDRVVERLSNAVLSANMI